MPSLGPLEIIVLALCALGPAAIALAVVLMVVSQTRRPSPPGAADRSAALEEENCRLREELSRKSQAIRRGQDG